MDCAFTVHTGHDRLARAVLATTVIPEATGQCVYMGACMMKAHVRIV